MAQCSSGQGARGALLLKLIPTRPRALLPLPKPSTTVVCSSQSGYEVQWRSATCNTTQAPAKTYQVQRYLPLIMDGSMGRRGLGADVSGAYSSSNMSSVVRSKSNLFYSTTNRSCRVFEMALGRITNSLLSGVVDTTISLATLNADFSLVRVTVPKEYNVVGQSLSRQRRSNAEEGPFHQATRRLGALFGDIAPSTPHLIRAYGSRISEIISHPGVNPTGTLADGPFQDFVGADATSIWAAATSGIAFDYGIASSMSTSPQVYGSEDIDSSLGRVGSETKARSSGFVRQR